MKTRNELYNGEGAELLRFITTYHTLLYEQVLRLFPKNRDSIKSLITNLVKQGRIIHDKENDLLCGSRKFVVGKYMIENSPCLYRSTRTLSMIIQLTFIVKNIFLFCLAVFYLTC